jgi:hypothetical protein
VKLAGSGNLLIPNQVFRQLAGGGHVEEGAEIAALLVTDQLKVVVERLAATVGGF